jgi:hypothetical protein
MRLHAAPRIAPGRVIVVEDGEVVADGRLADLVRTDRDEIDVEAFKARWFERRLN